MSNAAELISALASLVYIGVVALVVLKEVLHVDLFAEVRAFLAERRERDRINREARRLLEW